MRTTRILSPKERTDEMARIAEEEVRRTGEGVTPESAETESLEAYFESLRRRSPKRVKQENRGSVGRRLFSLFLTFLLTVIFVLLVRQYVLQHNTVIGSSMKPTLEDRDEIFVEKLSKLFPAGLKRGAIVTADTHSRTVNGDTEYVIKRIIGLPGEQVTIKEGKVLIDGQSLDEPYLDDWTLTDGRQADYADLVLGQDEYYLLGDNRSSSRDSRDVGPFHREDIVGCLILRFFPFDRMGKPK